MRLLKIGFFIFIIFIFVFSTTIFGLNQQDTQSRIQEIESLLDNTLTIWKIKKGNILCFIARDVPSLGYRIYKISQGEKATHESSLKVGKTTLESRLQSIPFKENSFQLDFGRSEIKTIELVY